jgi:3-dehydroquinate synthase
VIVATPKKIEVIAAHPYPIWLDVGLEDLGQHLESVLRPGTSVLVVSQPQIAELYYQRLADGFKAYSIHLAVFPNREEEKSLARLQELTAEAVAAGLDRDGLIVALGGGVVGDLAGFLAATYMRGVRFLQVPTTLLAQVDSSIGGKVAVNHPAGKNLLGAFYPPIAVWTDFTTLDTLPWEEIQNGLAETVKHAVLGDVGLFEFLEEHAEGIKGREGGIWREMIRRSIAVKVRIVSEDEKEKGQRALLNLGHSFGHALESVLGYTGITHGQGVSIGTVAACHIAQRKGYLKNQEMQRIQNMLQVFGLPAHISGADSEELLLKMQADKKNKEGKKVIILPVNIGRAAESRDCSDDELREAWQEVLV